MLTFVYETIIAAWHAGAQRVEWIRELAIMVVTFTHVRFF